MLQYVLHREQFKSLHEQIYRIPSRCRFIAHIADLSALCGFRNTPLILLHSIIGPIRTFHSIISSNLRLLKHTIERSNTLMESVKYMYKVYMVVNSISFPSVNNSLQLFYTFLRVSTYVQATLTTDKRSHLSCN
jgi:hypothetical protein